jgi:hypothetical protein
MGQIEGNYYLKITRILSVIYFSKAISRLWLSGNYFLCVKLTHHL